MPTYEYVCTECGERIEVFQRLSEEPLRVCTTCGGPLRKLFHPAGIVFKGSGFYSTDNRSAKTGSGAKRKTEDSATKESTSSESAAKDKPSKKSATKERSA